MSSTNIHNKKNDDALLYAHQFLEEAKEEEMEATAGAMLPQDAKKKYVVGSSKVEYQKKKAAVIMPPQDENDSSNIVVPAVSSSTAAALPRDVVAAPSQQNVRPGAFAVRGPGFIPQDDSFLHVNTAPAPSADEFQDEPKQLEPESLFKAVLVEDSEIPSASIFDHEAAEKAYCRRQGWRVLATAICGDWHLRFHHCYCHMEAQTASRPAHHLHHHHCIISWLEIHLIKEQHFQLMAPHNKRH